MKPNLISFFYKLLSHPSIHLYTHMHTNASNTCCVHRSVIVLDSRPNETRLRESVPRSVENFNMTYTEVEELGEKKPTGSELASGDDVTVLMYTSGTTGNAKGAMLSSRAIMVFIVFHTIICVS